MKILILTLALSLSACLKDETISGQISSADVWVLQSLNNTPVSSRITLSFPQKGRIAGQAPCNQYAGKQSAPLPWFEVAAIASSKMACNNLALESLYFKTLAKMTLIEQRETSLLLTNDSGGSLQFNKE